MRTHLISMAIACTLLGCEQNARLGGDEQAQRKSRLATFGDPSACLNSPKAMVLDGSGFVLEGTRTFDASAAFTAFRTDQKVEVNVRTDNSAPSRKSWSLRLAGKAVAVGTYQGLSRPLEDGEAGFSLFGEGHGCNVSQSRVQVHELALSEHGVDRLLVSFEQRCEKGSDVVGGCINFTGP